MAETATTAPVAPTSVPEPIPVVRADYLPALLVPAYLCILATGQELFPDVDSSEFTMHVRASGGPRVEETERYIEQIENMVAGRKVQAKRFAQELGLAKRLGEDDFLKAIREGTPPPVTGEDGVASLAVAIQCLNGRDDATIVPKPAPYIEAVPARRRAARS